MFNLKPCSLTAFHNRMYMRVRFIDVQHKRVSMLERELLPEEIPCGCENTFCGCPGRHREQELVDQLRRLPTRRGSKVGLPSMLVEIEIPILQQLTSNAVAAKSLAIVRSNSRSP